MKPKAVVQNVLIRDLAPGRLVIPVNQIFITNQNYAAARMLSREKSLLSHYNINECFYKWNLKRAHKMFRFAIQLPGDWSYPLTRFLSQIEILQKNEA